MDEISKRLEEAIICAQDADTSPSAVERRHAAISFINELRSNPQSWKIAFQTFLSSSQVFLLFLRVTCSTV